ncbi:MAG: TonB-dependent receptor [Deltaproteobacteria bacterium]|jgi:outer membrane receptor protein involved in Fe transport|nr:TonB-dependent receptor [Deltaproteobacteria bacterium]
MKKVSFVWLVAVASFGFLTLGSELVFGQEALPPVEVAATFVNPPLTTEQKAESTNRQVFDSVQLENSSAEVLSDFLAEMGIGVYKTPTDHGHTLMTIRGFRTDHLSKELDGRVMFLINGHRTGTGNATQIPLVNVERIEILRGPEMLKYSAASSGGIINVVTKKGGPDKLSGSLEFGVGSFNHYKTQLKLNGLVNGFDYSIGYGYTERDDYEDGEGYKVKHTGVQKNQSIMGELGYTFNGKHRISWSTYYYKVDKAERPAYYDPTDPNALFYMSNTIADRYNINNTFSYTGATEDDRWSWEVSYTFGENLNEVFNVDQKIDGATPMASSFDRKLLQTSLTYKGDNFTLTGGFDYLDYDTGEGTASSYNANNGVFTRGKKRVLTGNFKNLAGYLVGNVRFLDEKVIISAGLRYDHYKVTDKRIDPGDYIAPVNPNVYGYDRWASGQTYSHLSPSLGVSYLPLDWLKIRANWTHSFRPPSPRELTSGWYESYGFWGFPWNKAENTDSYEFGFDINHAYVNFSGTYFWSYTKDYIYQHVDPIQDRQRVRNSDKQRREGIELQLSSNIAGLLGYDNFELTPYFNLSHLFRNEELYKEGYPNNWGRYTNTYANYIPKTTIGAGIRYRYPKIKLSAKLNFSYWGKVYHSVAMMTPDTYNPDLHYPGFTVVDFSIRKGLIDFADKGNLEIKLDINNLFDRLYAYGNPDINRNAASNYYMPGRNFYVALIYNY